MSRRPVQNFRGMVAVLLHGADRHREVLAEGLARLGVTVHPVDPCAAAEAVPAVVDLLIVDGDVPEATTAAAQLAPAGEIPLVAIVGLETPSRLQRMLDLAPTAVVTKPVRATGLYTALYVAVNEHRRRQEAAQRMAGLEARHRARRWVVKALLELMTRHGWDDEQAFRHLRKESMRQRVTVEELARRLVAEPDSERADRIAREA